MSAIPPTSPMPVNELRGTATAPPDNLGGRTIQVGGNPPDLNVAIQTAQRGDTFVVPAGATYLPIAVPPLVGPGWVAVRSATHFTPGMRVSPADSPRMFKILGAGVQDGALLLSCPNPGDANPSLRHTTEGWRFIGLEAEFPNDLHQYAMMEIAGDRFSFESCLMRGRAAADLRRHIWLRGDDFQIWDSWLDEAHEVGSDSQTIGTRGNKRMHVENCELQAASENILLGDQGADFQTTDATIRRNHLFKPLGWMQFLPDGTPNPAYLGINQNVKNLFEIKVVQRALIEANLLENCWPASQEGTAVIINSVFPAGDPRIPQDIMYRSNIVKFAPHAFSSSSGYGGPPQRVAWINNLALMIGGCFLFLNWGTDDAWAEHNTGVPQDGKNAWPGLSHALGFYMQGLGIQRWKNLTLRRNIWGPSIYGTIQFDLTPANLDVSAAGHDIVENVVYGPRQGPVIAGIMVQPNAAVAGVDTTTGQIVAGSPLAALTSDGTVAGVDFAALAASQTGPPAPAPLPPAPVPAPPLPTPVPVTSPDGTQAAPGSGTVTDAAGHVWAFGTGTDVGGHVILRDGIQINGSAVRMTIKTGVIWVQNLMGNWYLWSGTAWTLEATAPFPAPAPAPAPLPLPAPAPGGSGAAPPAADLIALTARVAALESWRASVKADA